MIIGTTKELKNHEYRVGITPDNVLSFVADGHTVLVETGAGEGAGFAGGIISAALDGERIAEAIVGNLKH